MCGGAEAEPGQQVSQETRRAAARLLAPLVESATVPQRPVGLLAPPLELATPEVHAVQVALSESPPPLQRCSHQRNGLGRPAKNRGQNSRRVMTMRTGMRATEKT